MIKTIAEPQNLCINVYLKDGTEYLGKDIPPKPFAEQCLSFWEDESLITIPIGEVKRFALYTKES